MSHPAELPGSAVRPPNTQSTGVHLFIASPYSPARSKKRMRGKNVYDAASNCTWQYRIVHLKLFSIFLIEVSCKSFLPKIHRVLFHPALFQAKQPALSAQGDGGGERRRGEGREIKKERRRTGGEGGSTDEVWFKAFILSPIFQTVIVHFLTLASGLNSLECEWQAQASQTNGNGVQFQQLNAK